jgi:diguanylate cyclase (GGDEF)-like protein
VILAFAALLQMLPWQAQPTFEFGPPASPIAQLEWQSFLPFSRAQGLPQNAILALAQTPDGTMWSGSRGGLSWYDGKHWQLLALPYHAALQPWINALSVDASGALWIGTDRAGLWRYQGGQFEKLALPGLRDDEVTALSASAQGGVWLGGKNGLWRCLKARCEKQSQTDAIEVAVIAQNPNDASHLWVGTNVAGLLRLDLNRNDAMAIVDLRVGREQGLPNDAVRAIYFWGDGVWIGTGRGVAKYTSAGVVSYPTAHGFPGGVVAFAAWRGRLYAATTSNGLIRFTVDGSYQVLDLQQGLPERTLTALWVSDAATQQAQLWIGTANSGILRTDRERWFVFDQRHGIPGHVVLGVGEFRTPVQTSMWVGTDRGFVVQDGSHWKSVFPSEFNSLGVYDALALRDRVHLYGTTGGLLEQIDGRWHLYNLDNSKQIPGLFITRLFARPDGSAWFASHHGLGLWQNANVSVADAPTALRQAYVFDLINDPLDFSRDQAWISSADGLWHFAQGQFTRIHPNCLVDPFLVDLDSPLGQPWIWAASRDSVLRFRADDPSQCESLPVEPRYSLISQIRVDSSGRAYLFSGAGVTRLSSSNVGQALKDWAVEEFDQRDGLPAYESNGSSALDHLGRVWIATTAGAAVLQADVATVAVKQKVLELRLRNASTGQDVAPGSTLPARAADIRAELRIPGFDREYRHRFAVEMLGLDARLGAYVDQSEWTYRRLPPGQYTLVAHAKDADGHELASVRKSFRVSAPLWQHPLALSGFVLGSILAGFLIARWRTRNLALRALNLENQVRSRTQELAGANAKLLQSAMTDPLTGLANRRAFAQIWHDHSLRNQSALLMLLDIDHFKRINDSYGHDAGDQVLIELSKRLLALTVSASMQPLFLIRWGGEEFLLIRFAQDANLAMARQLAATCLAVVADTAINVGPTTLLVTTSIGADFWQLRSAEISTADRALQRADVALYAAKNAGRNQAFIASDDGPHKLA